MTNQRQRSPPKGGWWTAARLPVHLAGDVDVVHEALDVERQVRAVGAHQPLQLLTLLVEAHQRAGLGARVQLVLLAEHLAEVAHQHLVKLLAAERRVERRRQDLIVERRGGLSVGSSDEELPYGDGNCHFIMLIHTYENYLFIKS